MPTARVQTPDGRVMTIQVPDGATESEIQSFAEQQFAQLPEPASDPSAGTLGT